MWIFIAECQILDFSIIGKIWYIPCEQCIKLEHILSISIVTLPIYMLYMWFDNLRTSMLMMKASFDHLLCILFCSCFLPFIELINMRSHGWSTDFLASCFHLSKVDFRSLGWSMIFPWPLKSLCVDNQHCFWLIKCHWIYIYFHSFSFFLVPSCCILNSSLEYNLGHEWYQIWFHY